MRQVFILSFYLRFQLFKRNHGFGRRVVRDSPCRVPEKPDRVGQISLPPNAWP